MESVNSDNIKLSSEITNELNSLNESSAMDGDPQPKKKKVPRRVLHFSDGVIEEYSTDEDDFQESKDEVDAVKRSVNNELLAAPDPKSMYWSSWFWYHFITAGSTTLSVCDFLGEKLAAFFGITTPKYEYEIDFYKSMKAEEEERKKQQDLEMGGWVEEKQDKVTSSSVNPIDKNNIITSKERY